MRGIVGIEAARFARELALQRLGKGRHPILPARRARPQVRRGEIGERLADAGARLGKQHIGFVARDARVEGGGGGARIILLAGASFGRGAGQLAEPLDRLVAIDRDAARLWSRRGFLPLVEPREQPALALFGPGDAPCDFGSPWPSQAIERLRRGPRALAFGPVAGGEDGEQLLRGDEIGSRRLAFVARRRQAERAGEAMRRRHREARGKDKGEQLEQVETRQIGIAEPLTGQRRVQQDHRRLGGARRRFALGDLAHLAVGRGDPDARMACMQGGIG